uniref:Uncharacterized protein n=1 Tax=Strigamia maritima TaxID=126957 RepID=T1IL27_STRMM
MFEFYSVESLPTVASCSDPEVIKLLKMQKVPLAEPIPTITSDVHLLIGQDQLGRCCALVSGDFQTMRG